VCACLPMLNHTHGVRVRRRLAAGRQRAGSRLTPREQNPNTTCALPRPGVRRAMPSVPECAAGATGSGSLEPTCCALAGRCLGALAESEGSWPEHVLELLRSTELGAITEHPLFFREPGDCEVYGAGRVTLLGDAAHLTAAALGQVRRWVGPSGGRAAEAYCGRHAHGWLCLFVMERKAGWTGPGVPWYRQVRWAPGTVTRCREGEGPPRPGARAVPSCSGALNVTRPGWADACLRWAGGPDT
jgi:hypothetical protein